MPAATFDATVAKVSELSVTQNKSKSWLGPGPTGMIVRSSTMSDPGVLLPLKVRVCWSGETVTIKLVGVPCHMVSTC